MLTRGTPVVPGPQGRCNQAAPCHRCPRDQPGAPPPSSLPRGGAHLPQGALHGPQEVTGLAAEAAGPMGVTDLKAQPLRLLEVVVERKALADTGCRLLRTTSVLSTCEGCPLPALCPLWSWRKTPPPPTTPGGGGCLSLEPRPSLPGPLQSAAVRQACSIPASWMGKLRGQGVSKGTQEGTGSWQAGQG